MFALDEEKSLENPEEDTAVEEENVETTAEASGDSKSDESEESGPETAPEDTKESPIDESVDLESSSTEESEEETTDEALEEDPIDEPVDLEASSDEGDDEVSEETPVEESAEIETSKEEEPVEETPESPPEEDDGREWYVVHCYSGYENKVRHNLEQRMETMGMKNMIFDVVVPTEEEIEVKDGKRRTVERRVFPGYILVNMILEEESWYVVRNTPGVTSFVGMGNEPIPLRPEEVSQIIKRMESDAPRVKLSFRQGERVRITEGPFNDFRGTVDEINMEKAKVRVMVNFFGRETPVELDFLQVEKA